MADSRRVEENETKFNADEKMRKEKLQAWEKKEKKLGSKIKEIVEQQARFLHFDTKSITSYFKLSETNTKINKEETKSLSLSEFSHKSSSSNLLEENTESSKLIEKNRTNSSKFLGLKKVFFSNEVQGSSDEEKTELPEAPILTKEEEKKIIEDFFTTINSSFQVKEGQINLDLLDKKEWQAMIIIEKGRKTRENYEFMQDYHQFVHGHIAGMFLYNKYITDTAAYLLNIDGEKLKKTFVQKIEAKTAYISDFDEFFKSVAIHISGLMKLTAVSCANSLRKDALIKADLFVKPEVSPPTRGLIM